MKASPHLPGETIPVNQERGDASTVRRVPPEGNSVLLGRELERGQADRVLEAAREGLSAVLVLQGEPGVGKTTLLNYAMESARDFDVVRVVGIESEAELGFAALHQLLLPFLGRLNVLPVP